jgi:mono/diheme cytochrome c family protein
VKSFLLGFIAGLIALILCVAGYLRFGFLDVRSDVPASGLTRRVLYSGIHASVRRTAPKAQSPLPRSDETLIAGGKLYLADCVGCHGEPGKPASQFGATFYPPAPQFSSVGTKYSASEVYWIAKHGIRRTGMSAQASSYKDAELWELAAFISRFPKLPPSVETGIRKEPGK